jgi:hypothetical protein
MKRTKPSLERNKTENKNDPQPKEANLKTPSIKLPSSPNHRTPFSSHPPQSFLAPNNPRLTAQSFSPITGVGSGMISQFLSG